MENKSSEELWEEILQKSIHYLQSQEFKIWSLQEAPEMIEMIPLLYRINWLGYLTINSQCGHYERVPKKYEIIKQSYISGFMPRISY